MKKRLWLNRRQIESIEKLAIEAKFSKDDMLDQSKMDMFNNYMDEACSCGAMGALCSLSEDALLGLAVIMGPILTAKGSNVMENFVRNVSDAIAEKYDSTSFKEILYETFG